VQDCSVLFRRERVRLGGVRQARVRDVGISSVEREGGRGGEGGEGGAGSVGLLRGAREVGCDARLQVCIAGRMSAA
jgi:hypothetical protein